MKEVTWEQFQKAYQKAEQSVKDFIDSHLPADIANSLVNNGLPKEAWKEAIGGVTYVALGLITREEFLNSINKYEIEESNKTNLESILRNFKVNKNETIPIKSILENPKPLEDRNTLSTKPKEPAPSITIKPPEPVVPSGKVATLKDLDEKPKKVIPTGKMVGLAKEETESSVRGMRTMRGDINRLRDHSDEDAGGSNFTKPFKGS